MEIKDLAPNDDFGRCIRLCVKKDSVYEKKRMQEMKECNHLFVLIKKGEYLGACHSSDCSYNPCIVECVHCGLTNRFMEVEAINRKYKTSLHYMLNDETLETRAFREIFKHAYLRGGKSFDESVFNLISKEVLPTYHPGVLYELARDIVKGPFNDELFKVMKELVELETNEEKLRIRTKEQASDLMNRYIKYMEEKRKKEYEEYLERSCDITLERMPSEKERIHLNLPKTEPVINFSEITLESVPSIKEKMHLNLPETEPVLKLKK